MADVGCTVGMDKKLTWAPQGGTGGRIDGTVLAEVLDGAPGYSIAPNDPANALSVTVVTPTTEEDEAAPDVRIRFYADRDLRPGPGNEEFIDRILTFKTRAVGATDLGNFTAEDVAKV